MPLMDRVREAFGTLGADGRRTDVVVECRHCGQSLDHEDEACPACGGTEVARLLVN